MTYKTTRDETDASAPGETTNRTGLPDGLKAKMEGAFGTRLDHIRVNKNSAFPAKVGAIATTQGHRIDFAPGQYNPHSAQGQKLIGHEAWHTVQQAQGRVKPTLQMKTGHLVNDSEALEAEADRMGERMASMSAVASKEVYPAPMVSIGTGTIQRTTIGFEVQLLGSHVEIHENKEVAEQATDISPKFSSFGKAWTIEEDGKNLEIRTEPHTFKNRNWSGAAEEVMFLSETFDEITAFGQLANKVAGNGYYQVGDKTFKVHKGDRTGQIQTNADIPLDRYPTLVSEANRNRPISTDELLDIDIEDLGDAFRKGFLQEAFSADNVYGWNILDTGEELAAVHAAAKAIQRLDDKDLLEQVAIYEPIVDLPTPAAVAATLKGILTVLAHHIIHNTLFQKQYIKDQVMVHKVLTNTMIRKLVLDWGIDNIKLNEIQNILIAIVGPIVGRQESKETTAYIKQLDLNQDPVWSVDTNNPRLDAESLSDEESIENRYRQKLVVELRRSPRLPISKWKSFALAAFDYFMMDADGNYE